RLQYRYNFREGRHVAHSIAMDATPDEDTLITCSREPVHVVYLLKAGNTPLVRIGVFHRRTERMLLEVRVSVLAKGLRAVRNEVRRWWPGVCVHLGKGAEGIHIHATLLRRRLRDMNDLRNRSESVGICE